MCVKNINSYGCGHDYKEISPCGHNCTPEVGYKFIREYDCSACKAAGKHVSRGREGLGRHGQAISRRENKEELQSVTGPVIDHTGEISPWAQCPVERIGEKRLHSGHRRRNADVAWEHEHRSRCDDLCSRAESMSLRSDATPRPIPEATSSAYRRSPSPADFYSSTDDDRPSTRSRSGVPRFGEVMSVADITSMCCHSRRHHPRRSHYDSQARRSHYDSQESLDSIVPKVTSVSGRARKREYSFDSPDSGYGSRGSRSHRSHGSRAGSYSYSTSPQSHMHQPPAPSGQAGYGYPPSYYGVERAPIALPRYSTY